MTRWRWTGILSIALWSASWLAPANLHAGIDGYTIEDLQLKSAGDLVDVCNLDSMHEHHPTALAFCYGFFEGAIRFNEAISSPSEYDNLVCDPPETTRVQAVEVFVGYMSQHPQYAEEGPIDAIFRALMAKWPCSE